MKCCCCKNQVTLLKNASKIFNLSDPTMAVNGEKPSSNVQKSNDRVKNTVNFFKGWAHGRQMFFTRERREKVQSY
jgi:hypothetical protein